MKAVYLSSTVTLPGSPDRRSDAFEHDQMMDALRPAFSAAGIDLTDLAWDDISVDWSDYDAVIIGTAWDYWDRHDAFLAILDEIAAKTLLCNPPDLVRWNSHKRYLKDMEHRGAKLIPTLWIDEMTAETARAAFDHFGSDDLVFKRQVSAGADGQIRLKRGDPIPDMPHPMMVQPFLSAILEEGEFSFIFIDGELSHALSKHAATGDYRIQSTYGGFEKPLVPEAGDLERAKAMLATVPHAPLYARIDMLRSGGDLYLMEAELIEPFLYPLQGPELGTRLARGIRRRLGV